MQQSIFDEMRGVWIVDERLSRVFDISARSKQKLRSKRRNKNYKKMYANRPYIRILTVELEQACNRGSCRGMSLKIFAFEKIPPHEPQ